MILFGMFRICVCVYVCAHTMTSLSGFHSLCLPGIKHDHNDLYYFRIIADHDHAWTSSLKADPELCIGYIKTKYVW